MELDNLVRIGTVTDVDAAKRLARVKYQDTGITSDWLYALSGTPRLGATALCLYLPVSGDDGLPLFNSDGFILGVIGQ